MTLIFIFLCQAIQKPYKIKIKILQASKTSTTQTIYCSFFIAKVGSISYVFDWLNEITINVCRYFVVVLQNLYIIRQSEIIQKDQKICKLQFSLMIQHLLQPIITKMKPSQHKGTTPQHSHPSLFSISIFQSAQQFLALYLAIQNQNASYRYAAAKYLQRILHRTKSAPIALTYTKQFLLLTSESQIQLTIIRFISQLSDLSAGKSMQSSLSFIIDNSSFLTELRHNLTHRVMVKGLVIERGKQMILEELKDKYWKVMFQKVWKIYCIDEEQVQIFFDHITHVFEQKSISEQEIKKCKIYEEYQRKLKQQTESRLTKEYLFSECQSNYEFKSLIKPYILKKVLPALSDKSFNDEEDQAINFSSQINEQSLSGLINLSDLRSLSNTRSTILVSTMLEIILSMHKYKGANQCSKYRRVLSEVIVLVLVKIEEGQKQQTNKKASKQFYVFTSAVVTKKLRQIYLIHSIEEYGAVIAALSEEVRQSLQRYWAQKQVAFGKPIIFQA